MSCEAVVVRGTDDALGVRLVVVEPIVTRTVRNVERAGRGGHAGVGTVVVGVVEAPVVGLAQSALKVELVVDRVPVVPTVALAVEAVAGRRRVCDGRRRALEALIVEAIGVETTLHALVPDAVVPILAAAGGIGVALLAERVGSAREL